MSEEEVLILVLALVVAIGGSAFLWAMALAALL